MTWRYLIDIPWMAFVVYWAISALNTKPTEKRESFAARYGIMFLEVIGFVLLFRRSADIGFLGQRVIAAQLCYRCHCRRSHLGGHRAGDLGALASGPVLERTNHHKRRSQTDPHWSVCAPAAPDLFRAGPGGNRLRSRDRSLALRCGSLRDYCWFLDQGEKGRSNARQAVRLGFRGAPAANRISLATSLIRATGRALTATENR